MRHSAGNGAAFVCGLALSAAVANSGCAGGSPTLDRWLGRSPSPAASAGVFYSAVDGLTVYAGPARSSAVVGKLPRYERVVRSQLQGGFAQVQAGRSGLEGWVDNSKLLWRLPEAGAPSAAAAEGPAPEDGVSAPNPAASGASEVAPATGEAGTSATPPAREPEKPPAEPSKPKPSVFDPF